MSTSIHFSVKYDGPALVSHQMDARELAPALLALANLLEDANKTVFPDAEEVRVQVKGTFKSGSFGIDLIAIQSIAKQLVTCFLGARRQRPPICWPSWAAWAWPARRQAAA